MLKISTGLRTTMLGSSSLVNALANSVIRIYGSSDANPSEPATADAAVPANALLLCEITGPGGDPLEYEPAANGVVTKSATQAWGGTNAAAGTALWYRHEDVGDTGASSTSAPRVQGTVGIAGAEMNLSNIVLANGAPQSLDYYSLALPTL